MTNRTGQEERCTYPLTWEECGRTRANKVHNRESALFHHDFKPTATREQASEESEREWNARGRLVPVERATGAGGDGERADAIMHEIADIILRECFTYPDPQGSVCEVAAGKIYSRFFRAREGGERLHADINGWIRWLSRAEDENYSAAMSISKGAALALLSTLTRLQHALRARVSEDVEAKLAAMSDSDIRSFMNCFDAVEARGRALTLYRKLVAN